MTDDTPHRARLAAARARVATFAEREAAYLAGNPYRLVHDRDMRTGRYTVRADVTHAPPDDVGDAIAGALGELRASLDELASAAAGTPVRFPIFESLPLFAQRARKAIARMPDEVQAAVEALQPYHAIGGYANGPLWILDQLVAAGPPRIGAGALRAGAELGVNTARKVRLSGAPTIASGAFDAGAIVATESFTIVGPDPKIDLYFNARFALAFARTGPGRGAIVTELLGDIAGHLEHTVFPAIEPWLPPR